MAITISLTITIDGVESLPNIRIETPVVRENVAHESASSFTPPPPPSAQEAEQKQPDTSDMEAEPQCEEQDQAAEETPMWVDERNPPAKFIWTPKLVETLEREVQEGSQQTPKPTMRVLLQEIAARHGWPISAVTYKYYALKAAATAAPAQETLPEQQPDQAQPKQKRVYIRKKSEAAPADAQLPPDLEIPPLALEPGGVLWELRIDGIPTKQSLDYAHGAFPYPTNTRVSFRGKAYRVGRVWHAAVQLTSEDADTYETQ
jgi:hypothetical protein